jgi:hypothetical protein
MISRPSSQYPTAYTGIKQQTLASLQFNSTSPKNNYAKRNCLNTLRTGDANLRFYITTVQDG